MRAQNCLRHLGIKTKAQARRAHAAGTLSPSNTRARGLGYGTLREICAWADIKQPLRAPRFVIKEREWQAMPLRTQEAIMRLFRMFTSAVFSIDLEFNPPAKRHD